jgi:hypothetical protein
LELEHSQQLVTTKILLKNCEQNRVTIFARKSQKLINEMKEVNNFQNDLT